MRKLVLGLTLMTLVASSLAPVNAEATVLCAKAHSLTGEPRNGAAIKIRPTMVAHDTTG